MIQMIVFENDTVCKINNHIYIYIYTHTHTPSYIYIYIYIYIHTHLLPIVRMDSLVGSQSHANTP